MPDNFEDHRFSDEELRRIFEDAAQSETRRGTPVQSGKGYTIADIREIAQEVGIDSAAIDRAAANVLASEEAPATSSHWLGFSRVVHAESVIRRGLSSAEMRLVALQAERILGRRGQLRDSGDWVEWRDIKDRLYVGVVRGENRTRIRVIADQSRELVLGGSVIGILGAGSLQTAFGLQPVPAIILSALIAAATWGVVKFYWRWRSSVTAGHVQDMLEILEDAVGVS